MKLDDDYEEFSEEVEKNHIDARESHCTQLQVDHNEVNLTIELTNDNEVSIGVSNVMVNLTIKFVDANFDEELLAKDEWL